jgi:tetratricopeptide (TPR) repeat protein
MLFDLKGRRKRLIQVTYVALALLFGIGLIGFGVGGGTGGGGLFDALGGGSGGGGDPSGVYRDQVKRYETSLRVNPKNDRALSALVLAQLNLARSGKGYDPQTGQFSDNARKDLMAAAHSWERYLTLKPRKPNPALASAMVQAYAALLKFGTGPALDQFNRAAQAQEILAKARPSSITYFTLAAINYQVGRIVKGDRAADSALEHTPKDQRNVVKAQIDEARKQGLKAKKQVKQAKKQAETAAKKARSSGQDPFGAAPGQSPLGGGGLGQ